MVSGPLRTFFALLLCLATSSCLLKKREAKADDGGSSGPGELHVISAPHAPRPPGWTLTTTVEIVAEEMPATLQTGARTLEGTNSSREFRQVVHQSLGADRFRVTIQRDERSNRYSFQGAPPKSETSKGVLVRKFVILEKKEGKWSGRFESGETPTEEEQELIDRYASDYDLGDPLCPRAQARVGEEWEIDASKTGWGDAQKGSLKVKFARVEDFEGEPCAVLTGSVDFKGDFNDGKDGEMTMKGKFTAHQSLRHFVTVNVLLEGTMEIIATPQLGLTLKTKGPIRWTERSTVSLPAPAVSQR